jgi:kynureninase
VSRIADAAAALPAGPLTEAALQAHIAPLFSRHLHAYGQRIYLANHSLGRPLDAMRDDVAAGLAAWYEGMGDAWTAWMDEGDAFRARTARLLGAPRPDCVVPKTSAGQGLRAVLNAFDHVPHVLATTAEFDSLDVILRTYAQRGRIGLELTPSDGDGIFDTAAIIDAIKPGVDLVVVSEVIFSTGQRLDELAAIVAAAHRVGARLLLDVYHSLGVFPVDVTALDVDFAVGGSYKYLRGGPGACFLYVAPAVLAAGLTTLDTGWFAKHRPFDYRRPDPPRFGPGGDAWLESTPPVLTWYQARAGAELVLALGVGRLREHSRRLQRGLCERLALRGLAAIGGTEDRGAFVVVRDPRAVAWAEALAQRGITVDARGTSLRLCPDILTTERELDLAAEALGAVRRG